MIMKFDYPDHNISVHEHQCISYETVLGRGMFPVDTGRKLNVHKTFRRRPGRLLNVLCTFNLRPVSTGLVGLRSCKFFHISGNRNTRHIL